ncbi:MAG: type 4a pilus biogenesis protein PilO [Planctomycetes bacterium]|nr:type 4a pilus biogenesis protein PilO [Planctomycetota bacterium]
MKFTVREAILLSLLVAIPMGSWWFVFRPRKAQIEEARHEIDQKRSRLLEMSRADEAIASLNDDIAQYNEAIEFFRSKLPQEKEIDQILREVWRLAQTHQLSTKSIRTVRTSGALSTVDPAGPYAEQPVALELEGRFTEGLYPFLLDLENMPRISRIHKMKVERLSGTDNGQVGVQMVMSVFFERQ